jgi:hypothetical protein
MNFSHELDEDGLSKNSGGEGVASGEASQPSAGAEAALPPPETAPIAAPADEAPPLAQAKTDSAPADQKAETPPQGKPPADAKPAIERPGASLVPFIPPQRSEAAAAPQASQFWQLALEKRYQIGAVAAGLALAGVLTMASIAYKAQQNDYLVSQSAETQNLAETVKALKAKIAALDAAKHDEIGELRKSVAELKSGLAAQHEAGSSVAQLSARFDRLEHEQGARIDKLGERIDHDAATHNAEVAARLEKIEKLGERVDHDATIHDSDFTARLEKLEKKAAAPAVVATLPPAPAAPAAALPKQPALLPAPAAGISKETTGSIAPPRGPIRGWTVREVHDGMAVVEGPAGFREIGPGDVLPGAGRVERIERRGRDWAVVTNQGYIGGAAAANPGYVTGPGYVDGAADGDFLRD